MGKKKGFRHSEVTKKRISRTLSGRGCGGFNKKVNCPICGKEMNPANLTRHTEACMNAQKYAYLFPVPKNSRQLKRFRTVLRVSHGMTLEEYADIFDKQNGVCCICGKKEPEKPLFVDHCHTEGKNRGLLCSNCNFCLGLCGESTEVLEKMIEYIKTHNKDPYKD